MTTPSNASPTPSGSSVNLSGVRRAAQVIIVSSVMFTFISFWRTAAVVLCDLASTVYYIGGVVESSIGPSAPWFILGVMVFSYFVRMVYIESCSLFVRGGVYRVVKEAMGGFLAKLSVSALMFDYVLTGPTSGVSAGQYVMGTILLFIKLAFPTAYTAFHLDQTDPGQAGEMVQRWGSVMLAVLVTLYFFRQNLRGIHESSDKAMKIMWATTIMAVILLVWCGVSLIFPGPAQGVPWQPDLNRKVEHLELKLDEGESLSHFRERLVTEYHIAKDRVSRFTDIELEGGINVADPSRLDHLAPASAPAPTIPPTIRGASIRMDICSRTTNPSRSWMTCPVSKTTTPRPSISGPTIRSASSAAGRGFATSSASSGCWGCSWRSATRSWR